MNQNSLTIKAVECTPYGNPGEYIFWAVNQLGQTVKAFDTYWEAVRFILSPQS